MLTRLGLVFVLVAGMSRSTAAQQPVLLRPGDSVKLVAPTLTENRHTPLAGVVSRIGPTDVFISTRDGAESRIPLAAVMGLRRASGIRRAIRPGIGVGMLVGIVAGGIAGNNGGNQNDEQQMRVAALLGAAVGGIVGSRIKTTRWESLSLNTLRPEPLPGTFVRIGSPRWSAAGPVSGTIRSWSADSVGFQREDDSAVLVLPASEVSSVEWPVTRRRQTANGALFGAVIGAIGGAIAAGAAAGGCSGFICFSPEEMALVGGIVGAGAGGTVGALVGYMVHSTRWEHGTPGPRRIAVAPLVSTHGGGLAMSISF